MDQWVKLLLQGVSGTSTYKMESGGLGTRGSLTKASYPGLCIGDEEPGSQTK